MLFEIIECSPIAKSRIVSFVDNIGVELNNHHSTKYPFRQMHIGQAITLKFDSINETSIRAMISTFNKKTGKRFSIIKHTDLKLYEIARIA